MIVLLDAENRTIMSSFVWTKYRNVTKGRTDSGLHCEQRGPAVKTEACMINCAINPLQLMNKKLLARYLITHSGRGIDCIDKKFLTA